MPKQKTEFGVCTKPVYVPNSISMGRCQRSAIDATGKCWQHHPDRVAQRKATARDRYRRETEIARLKHLIDVRRADFIRTFDAWHEKAAQGFGAAFHGHPNLWAQVIEVRKSIVAAEKELEELQREPLP